MQANSRLVELETAPLSRLLLRYSMPSIVGMAAVSIYHIIDAYYIGQWCDAHALAGMAFIFPIMNLMMAAGTLVGIGCANKCSLALGNGQQEYAFRLLGHTIVLGLCINVVFAALLYFNLPALLHAFGARGASFEPSYEFMRISVLSFPLTSVFLNLNHMVRASGYPRRAMVSLLITVGLNVLIAPFLILHAGLGMAGAAYATVISQVVGLIGVLMFLSRKKHVLHFKRGIYALDAGISRGILKVGLPPCLLNLCTCAIMVSSNRLFLAYEGPMGSAAFGVVYRFMFLFGMVVMGIAQGMQPIVGFNYGMGKRARAFGVLKRAMLASTVVTGLGALGFFLFPTQIMGLFVQEADANAAQIIKIGVEGMSILRWGLLIAGVPTVVSFFFLAIGKPALSAGLNLWRQVILMLPLLYILPLIWGEAGIWAATTIADTVSFAISLLLLSFYLRKYSL